MYSNSCDTRNRTGQFAVLYCRFIARKLTMFWIWGLKASNTGVVLCSS
jgi:hypothetical protein